MKTLFFLCVWASVACTTGHAGLTDGGGGGSGSAFDAAVFDAAPFVDGPGFVDASVIPDAAIPDAALHTCGNGHLDTGETCDDGPGTQHPCPTSEVCQGTCLSGTACNMTCKPCSGDVHDNGCQVGGSPLWLGTLLVTCVIVLRRRRARTR